MKTIQKANKEIRELSAIYRATDRVQAVVEFNLDGTVVSANENFLDILGYALDEIVGKHHRMFCEPGYAESTEYGQFWQKLNRGEHESGEFKRISKDGTEVWLQASYNPVIDADGKPIKVVNFGTDITATKLQNAEFEGKMRAINRAHAVIEFELDGTVITANENFLDSLGYALDEIVGKHHRMFCDPGYAESTEYGQFWQRLSRGEYQASELKRFNKDRTEVWLQASYNPILDVDGKPSKVVKFATDITLDVQRRNLALLAMSTPVTKIWDGILMLPIVGIVDSNRTRDLMQAMLTEIAARQAKVIILDISGVAMIDTAVANHLIKITKATRLMGCECTISGISAPIAQTMVELGIDVGTVMTTATLMDAIKEAFRRMGMEVRSKPQSD